MRAFGIFFVWVLVPACASVETPCELGTERCGEGCVDVSTNPAHCGRCGNACRVGEVCFGSSCEAECPAELEVCAGTCIDTNANPAHCGACGIECDAGGSVCVDGTCQEVCPAPRVACEGYCVDLQTDRGHCGACGGACGVGLLCSAGECATTCQDELEACGGRCIDTDGDRENCGRCGHECAPGNVCDRGACLRACPPGQVDCAGGCFDLQRDRTRCGDCGNRCADGEYCDAGVCAVTCSEGLSVCDGACVDLDHDPLHCNDCGIECDAGWACVDGGCRDIPLLTFPGVRTDLPIADLGGWVQCYVGTYNLTADLGPILAACDGDNLMLACRPTGDDVLRTAAHAPRDDVLFATGRGNVPHNANNVGWYYDNSYSWGFARMGDVLSRSSCDTANTNPEERLCWHTGANRLNGGWRCGATRSLNGSVAWERLIYHY